MASAGILVLCVAAAIVYGIVHDQITARICLEYFTIGHPPVFPTDDPTLLGLGWGIIATWWVGLILGLLLIPAARLGNRPPRPVRSLVRPILILMIVAGFTAIIAGVAGSILAKAGTVELTGSIAEQVPKNRHPAYIACLFAHTASYAIGFVGGGVLIATVWAQRGIDRRKGVISRR